jgi:hypothetical protein
MDQALKRGEFTEQQRKHIMSTSKCVVAELFSQNLIKTDRLVRDLCFGSIVDAVVTNQVKSASNYYDRILRIRNEQYE